MATVPSSMQPISGAGGLVTTVWQRFFNALASNSPGAIQQVEPTGSPYSFTASAAGSLVISSGTVTGLKFTRASTSLTLGSAPLIPMANGDVVEITYSAQPTLFFIPS